MRGCIAELLDLFLNVGGGGRKGRGKLAASALRHRARRRDTYDRYETGKKGFELKTSDSRNRCSRSHDIGGVGGYRGGKDKDERRAMVVMRTECRLAASAVVPSSNGQIGIYFRRGGDEDHGRTGGTGHST